MLKTIALLSCIFVCEASFVEAKTRVTKRLNESSIKNVTLIGEVAGQPITGRDLEARVALVLLTSHMPLNDENKRSIREQVLKNMIEELVQLETAKKYKVTAKDAEIKGSLQNIAKENNMSLSQLEEMLKSHGISIGYMRDRIKAQLSWINFVRGAYGHMAHVSEKDIDQYYKKLQESEKKDQYEIYEIFLRVDGSTEDAAVKKQAERIIEEIRKGGNFRVQAQQFSNSPSASNGGAVGWVTAAHEGFKYFSLLEPGQLISKPARTNHGYYIYFLADKKLAGQAAGSEALISYKKIRVPLTPGFKPEDDPYLAMHMNELMACKSVKDLERVAKERDLPTEAAVDRKMAQIPSEMHGFFRSLSVGQVPQPVFTPEGMLFIILTGRRAGEPEKPPSREETKQILESEKLSKFASQYLTQLLSRTYIKLHTPEEFPNISYGKSSKITKPLIPTRT